jgi:4-hydroxy 2-oxovalerate aldolase
MSSALTQAFLMMSAGKRQVVVDAAISGMGRGAGNTPTELIAQYMVSKLGYHYDIDAILDLIDTYMGSIRTKYAWGYSTQFFIAGTYGAHVNNIEYLSTKNSIRSRDIRYILNKVGSVARKRYDYDLLENTYKQYMESDIDDAKAMDLLKEQLGDKNVVVMAPGSTVSEMKDIIEKYIAQNNAKVIQINFVHTSIKADYLYFSNVKRYDYWSDSPEFKKNRKIITSNIGLYDPESDIVISFKRLIKCGWENLDNSTILLLRLLDQLSVRSIGIAGFDGYDYNNAFHRNYVTDELEQQPKDNWIFVNNEITMMLKNFMETKRSNAAVSFITPSKYESALE